MVNYSIIVHQYKEYYQNLHYNVPLDWIFHHTTSDFMYIYGWLKSMTQLSNVCGASLVNNPILFLDGHGSNFNNGALRQMMCKNTQPFVLKSGGSVNNRPNDNVPNSRMNYLSTTWQRVSGCFKYGMKKIPPHHMKSVSVEA